MSKPEIFQKSPIIKDVKPGTYFWCSCGKSDNQPYCDSSHKGSGFQPVKEEIREETRIAWCACKHSGNKPYCDGTHKGL